MLAIAKDVGVGSGTVQRVAREMQADRHFEGVSEAALRFASASGSPLYS
jgi:hypothetical protein